MLRKHLSKIRSVCSLAIVLSMVLVCLSACGQKDQSGAADDGLPTLEKIADNLYETTYTEDFDWGDTVIPNISGFACSAVQNGQFRGRNYDWTYADTDICIIHTTVTENRAHASVGVADLSFAMNEDGSFNLAKLPFVTVDGINDAHVCIQVNVMPFGENGEIGHSEAAEDDLAGARVVRYILDYADSVEDALALLESKDIHSEMGVLEELHWMISGPASKTDSSLKTVIVEVFPDGLHIIDHFVDDKPIMANFNVSNFDGTPESLGIGFGYERWQILNEYYDQANSIMGTFDLMEKVYYTKAYDLYGDRYWYSEFNGYNLCDYYEEVELKALLGEKTYNYYMDNYGGVYYTSALWDGETRLDGDISKAGIAKAFVEESMGYYSAQNKEDGSLWMTIHTSVYDLENGSLDIQVRESHDHLRFTID